MEYNNPHRIAMRAWDAIDKMEGAGILTFLEACTARAVIKRFTSNQITADEMVQAIKATFTA